MVTPAMQLAGKIPDVHVQLWASAILKDLYRCIADEDVVHFQVVTLQAQNQNWFPQDARRPGQADGGRRITQQLQPDSSQGPLFGKRPLVLSIFLRLFFFSDFYVFFLGHSATGALPHQVDRRTFSCVNISQRCQHQQG